MLIYSMKLFTMAICACCLCIIRFSSDKKSIKIYKIIAISIFFIIQISSMFLQNSSFYLKIGNILSDLIIFILIIIYNQKYLRKMINRMILYAAIFILNLFLEIVFKKYLYLDYMCNLLILFLIMYKESYLYNKKVYKKYKAKKARFNRLTITSKLYSTKLETLKGERQNNKQKMSNNLKNLNQILLNLDTKIYFIDQSLTNVYEYVFEENNLYKVNGFYKFFRKEMISNLIVLETIYNVLYDCEEHSIQVENENKEHYNYRIIPNIAFHDIYGILIIKKDLSYEYDIKEKYKLNHNEFKNIIDNMPYDIILEKNNKILYKNKELEYDQNLMSIILDNNINGDILYNLTDVRQNNIYVNKVKLEDENKNLIILKDLSEHNSLMNKMKQSKQKYELFVDIILEGVIIIDDNSKEVRYKNKSLNKILETYKLTCRDICKIIDDSSLNYCDVLFNMKFENKKISNYLGEDIYFEFANMVLNINNKNIVICVFRDITQKIKNEKIKNKIKQESYNKKLKNDFLINLSHELKTPVNLIYLKNQLTRSLCNKKNNIIKNDHINMLSEELKNIEQLMYLIDNIISLEKLNLDFYEDNRDYYNIVELLESAVIKINEYNKNVNIIFDTNYEEIVLFIDSNNLIMVIIKLLAIISRYSKKEDYINFDIEKTKDKTIIHIYNKNIIQNNIKNDGMDIIQSYISLCELVLKLYGGKLEVKKDFTSINIKLKSEEHIEYTYKNEESLIKEDFITQEFQKIYNL